MNILLTELCIIYAAGPGCLITTDLLQTNYQWWMATSKSLQAPLLHPNLHSSLSCSSTHFACQLFFHPHQEPAVRRPVQVRNSVSPWSNAIKFKKQNLMVPDKVQHSLLSQPYYFSEVEIHTRVKFLHFGHYKSKAMFSKKFTFRVPGLECSSQKIFVPVAG